MYNAQCNRPLMLCVYILCTSVQCTTVYVRVDTLFFALCIECSYPPHTLPPVQSVESGEIVFYMKGADTVMASIVQYNDWLDEEVRENTETDIECL